MQNSSASDNATKQFATKSTEIDVASISKPTERFDVKSTQIWLVSWVGQCAEKIRLRIVITTFQSTSHWQSIYSPSDDWLILNLGLCFQKLSLIGYATLTALLYEYENHSRRKWTEKAKELSVRSSAHSEGVTAYCTASFFEKSVPHQLHARSILIIFRFDSLISSSN